jgi:DNA-binding SARP family transcriptional activator
MIYGIMGQEPLSEEMLLECIRTSRECGNQRAEGYALDSLADLERNDGRHEAAKEHYEEALELARSLGEMTLSTLALLGLADLERIAGRRDSAESLARQALASAEERDSTYERAQAHATLGRIARSAGDLGKASLLLEKACEMFERAGAQRELAEALYLFADALIPQRSSRRTLRQALEALPALVESLGYDSFLARVAGEMPEAARYAVSRRVHVEFYRRLARVPVPAAPEPITEPAQEGALPAVDVKALGTVEVSIGGHLLTAPEWQSEKSRELLLLLMFCGKPLRRDEVVSALWPERGGRPSISAFHTTVHRTRRALYPECIVESGGLYMLNDKGTFTSDVQRFRASLRRARAAANEAQGLTELSRAIGLYGGAFAPAVDAEWADLIRLQLEEQFVEAGSRLSRGLMEGGQYSEAASVYDRMLEVDGLNETACYGAMECQLALQNPSQAAVMYRRYRAALEAEIGQRPGPAVERLHEKVLKAARFR